MKDILRDARDLLLFRLPPERMAGLGPRHLAVGLACTWLVGMGRYWDSPEATPLQHLGLGSVIYVFALSAVLWLLCAPLRPRIRGYVPLLAYVTLTSPPAILYAIPVERFYSVETAATINVWFLAVVAVWRFALLVAWLRRGAGFDGPRAGVAALLPVAAIVTVLASLNLERATFDVMGGLRDTTANDSAFAVVILLSCLSMFASPLLLITYLALVLETRKRPREEDAVQSPP